MSSTPRNAGPRIPALKPEDTPQASIPILEQVKGKFGRVPNFFATMARSPAALKAVTGMFAALEGGALSPRRQEALALRIGQLNACDYCVAAHTGAAAAAGASRDEALGYRKGQADDATLQALLDLAAALAAGPEADLDGPVDAARKAGATDEDLLEVVAHVALNVFTNYTNALCRTELDFPAAAPLDES